MYRFYIIPLLSMQNQISLFPTTKNASKSISYLSDQLNFSRGTIHNTRAGLITVSI